MSPRDASPPSTLVDPHWHLSDLFPDDAAADRAIEALEADVEALQLPTAWPDVASLVATLTALDDLRLRRDLVRTYAHSQRDTDGFDAAIARRAARVDALIARFDQRAAVLEPRLLAEADTLAAWVDAPALATWSYPLRRVLKRAPHTLSDREEALLAGAQELATQAVRTYMTLTNSELVNESIEVEGERVEVDRASWLTLRTHPDATVRRACFDALFRSYAVHERSIGQLVATNTRFHVFDAEQRAHPSAKARALHADALPTEVLDTLLAEARAGRPVLRRALDVRRRATGLERLDYADRYIPVDDGRRYGWSECVDLALAAVAPLGDDYVQRLAHGLSAGWTDVWPAKGKRNGAYMNGSAYGVHPFVFLNHTEDASGLRTLVHEFGHALHTVYASEAQPYATHRYPIFLAEIASTLDENLLVDHLLATATDRDQRLAALIQAIDGIVGTFFRQTLFAELEVFLHDELEARRPLTGQGITERYGQLLDATYGDAVVRSELDAWEWLLVPHFFFDFYVWKYASSLAAASALTRALHEEGEPARARILDLWRAGGSDEPHALLLRAGVDLASPQPYRDLVARLDWLCDEADALLDPS